MDEREPTPGDVPGLNVEHEDGIAVLTLDRSERRNALDRAMLDGLADTIAALDHDPDVRALVLTGAGGAFCAGGDLDVIGGFGQEDEHQARTRMRREFASSIRLRRCGKPTIAAVDGPAVGAGMALALACDVRIGTPRALFASPFASMALVPDFGLSWLLTKVVGADRATELLVTGRKVRSDEAVVVGMLHQVVDDALEEARRLARLLADVPSATIAATTRLVERSANETLEQIVEAEIEAQIAALAGPDFARAVANWTAAVRSR